MNKEEVLSKSRGENKNRDLHVLEAQSNGGIVSALTALSLATIFVVIQLILDQGFNFGLYAIVFSVGAAGCVYTAIKIKRKRDIILAVVYTIATIIISSIHVYQLIENSTII